MAESRSTNSATGPDVSGLRIGRSLGTRTTELGSSFERERHELMWRRARLVLGIGLAINVLMWFLTLFAPVSEPVTEYALWEWKDWLDLLYPGSFAAGLAYLYFGRPGIKGMQTAVFVVLSANVVASLVQVSLARPEVIPGFGIALALFVPAAFIPWHLGYQAALAGVTLAITVGAPLFGYQVVPEIREYWQASAADGMRFEQYVLMNAVGTVLLGATSVFITWTLYGLRKTAFQARRLGNYVLHREIGKGGMGTVYVAEHALMCRPSAVKVLEIRGGGDDTAVARFEREVRLSASLSHPNTITIFDFGRASTDVFYYAMEYLEGMDLERFVRRFGPIRANRALYLLLQITGSLAEAHERGIVHRDLKPSNVFLTTRGGLYDFVKVLDFGLAKRIEGVDAPAGLTKTGIVFGTPRYLAPESVYGTAGVGPRSDIYALGAVAYWMLTGRPPFDSDSALELMIDHVKSVPSRPSEVCELPIPVELDEVVMRCLEKDPNDRFHSIAELEDALAQVPDPEPWTRGRAAAWWRLHMSDDEAIRDCFCPPDELLTTDSSPAELEAAGAIPGGAES